MDINIGTLAGQTIAMIVFVWFCMKYIWPPILEAIENRQKEIEEGLAAAVIDGGAAVSFSGAASAFFGEEAALERGVIEAFEFNNPTSDRQFGAQNVSKDYMLGSYHQAAEFFEIIFNKSLPRWPVDTA